MYMVNTTSIVTICAGIPGKVPQMSTEVVLDRLSGKIEGSKRKRDRRWDEMVKEAAIRMDMVSNLYFIS